MVSFIEARAPLLLVFESTVRELTRFHQRFCALNQVSPLQVHHRQVINYAFHPVEPPLILQPLSLTKCPQTREELLVVGADGHFVIKTFKSRVFVAFDCAPAHSSQRFKGKCLKLRATGASRLKSAFDLAWSGPCLYVAHFALSNHSRNPASNQQTKCPNSH
jgi:hypothetical protein